MALDHGTTSTRAIIFDHSGSIVSTGQREHDQILMRPGWVEHNPKQIWANVREVIAQALARADLTSNDIAAIGITNQRATTVVWDRRTGDPVYNAIVWQDTRTHAAVQALASKGGVDRFKARVGLPLGANFSATKIQWILTNIAGAREDANAGHLLFGNTDAWIVWNLTGGVDGGIHATDVTNASQTLLMDIRTMTWDEEVLDTLGVPVRMMPSIRSSSEVYGTVHWSQLLGGTPVAGILGDQQAAAFGQAAFGPGEAKNTYGTGCFLIFNTGEQLVESSHGLLSTVAYQLQNQPPQYALEGAVAAAGSLVQWLRDNLGLISELAQVEELAASVADSGGVFVVPAFSGLFAPYWRPDARGAMVGLTHYSNRGHVARAALEATAFQVRAVLDAVRADAGVDLKELKVDGGMVGNEMLMQFQADLLGVDVVRPIVSETTALGAAYSAGLAVGFWGSLAECAANWGEAQRWHPTLSGHDRQLLMSRWEKAVNRSLNWLDLDVE